MDKIKHDRFNIDQVPFNLGLQAKYMYALQDTVELPQPTGSEKRFGNLIRSAGGQSPHGPKAKTEAWQPIDRGLGMLTKVLAGEFQTTWLDQDWERWNSKSMHIAEFQVIAMNLTPIELPDKYLLRQLGRLPCA